LTDFPLILPHFRSTFQTDSSHKFTTLSLDEGLIKHPCHFDWIVVVVADLAEDVICKNLGFVSFAKEHLLKILH
jgi:hypothetical protein